MNQIKIEALNIYLNLCFFTRLHHDFQFFHPFWVLQDEGFLSCSQKQHFTVDM